MFRSRGTTLCIGKDAEGMESLPWQQASGTGAAGRREAFALATSLTRQHRDVVHWHGDVWAVERSSRAKADLRPA